ncbi:hypothetical protein HA402_012933 [Bradysia odoriphaga]|nr:hypothetical protein HA402_012933 [Bradysia odoriphaga]
MFFVPNCSKIMWSISRRVFARSKLIQRNFIQQNETFQRRFYSRRLESEIPNVHLERRKSDILKATSQFFQNEQHRKLLRDHDVDDPTIDYLFETFRENCLDPRSIAHELYDKLNDVIEGVAHPDEFFPLFLEHATKMLPEKKSIQCLRKQHFIDQIIPERQEDIKQNSDLTNPPSWYPEARCRKRRIVYHAGPTNSGKTYRAMQRFLEAKTAIYCGPLRLLAVEVFQKSNKMGTPCDLVTGENRQYGNLDGSAANHISVTSEMCPVGRKFDVAVIDEIQMVRDVERGGSWTRAFLGVNADEVHICGESGARELIERLCQTTGETVEYHHYDRLTPLTVENTALESLDKLEPGDCVVCFSKEDIFTISRQIQQLDEEVAVIYGTLPPNVKLAQAAKFNDPNHSCKIMVATDAIGMGLNLSIRRIIFFEMRKRRLVKHRKEYQPLTVSETLQIAGRAGRFGTQWEHGYVTAFKRKDLNILRKLLSSKPEPITQAGLHPTIERIESYAKQFPDLSLSSIMDLFTSNSTLNGDLYFMSNMDDFKALADIIRYIDLPFRIRYVYCLAPVNTSPDVIQMFTEFARRHSCGTPITCDFVAKECNLPAQTPQSTEQLSRLEKMFEVLLLYLWLSYRFKDVYPDGNQIRSCQKQLEDTIQKGLAALYPNHV